MKNKQTIDEAVSYAILIQQAIAYDDNICAPTITLKENLFLCILRLKQKGLLNT